MNKEKATKAVGVKKAGAPISHGVGRRKCSVARVWLRKGTGQIIVNGRTVENYFDTAFNRADAATAFTVISDSATKYDAEVNVTGGGVCSQAGAVRLGIARALVASDEGYRKALRAHDLLTVDSRQVERKKYGQSGARRRFQFVKR